MSPLIFFGEEIPLEERSYGVQRLSFTFEGDDREYTFKPSGELYHSDWQFDIFSPDGAYVHLLQDHYGPYHVVTTAHLKEYLSGERGPDYVTHNLQKEAPAYVHSDGTWASNSTFQYTMTCCGQSRSLAFQIIPPDLLSTGQLTRFSPLHDQIVWAQNSDGISIASLSNDVDGDAIGDTLYLERSMGSGFSTTEASLFLSASEDVINITTTTAFGTMINFHNTPPDLTNQEMRPVRNFVEDVLFPNMRDEADPSLNVLLNKQANSTWQKSPIELPDTYALFIEDITAYMNQASLNEETYAALQNFLDENEMDGPIWIEYLGDTHRLYAKDARPNPDLTQTLDENETHVLLGTKHGVILYDKDTQDYLWIYVSRSADKLRHASILSASFEGTSAVNITRQTLSGQNETLMLHLNEYGIP